MQFAFPDRVNHQRFCAVRALRRHFWGSVLESVATASRRATKRRKGQIESGAGLPVAVLDSSECAICVIRDSDAHQPEHARLQRLQPRLFLPSLLVSQQCGTESQPQ